MKTPNARLALFVLLLVLSGCADKNPARQVESAKEYLQKNDSKSALIQIKNALQTDPELPEARFLLGTILLKDGDGSAAEIEFRKALAAKYPQGLVVPELARAMVITGQAKKLVEEFGQLRLAETAADASLQTTLAAAYGLLEQPALSQAALDAALRADPGHVPALIGRARQRASAKDFEGALSSIEAVIAKNPANSEAWKLKGDVVVLGKGNAHEALAAFRKSTEVNPQFVPGYLAALAVLIPEGKFGEAAKNLEQLKKFAPDNPQTKYFEAQLAYQKKDYKSAKELAQQLLVVAPEDPRVLELAGAIEFQTNSLVQAETYLAAANRAGPELALARRLLITTYLRSGQSAKALAALNASAAKDGLDPSMFPLAGRVHLQNGDAKTAEGYFTKALKLDPESARKRTSLAVTHLATGQPTSALDDLQSVAESDADTTADLALISAYLRRNELDKALVAVGRLEAKQPDKPLAAELRGRIQLAQKNGAAARKSFEQALAIDPTYFSAAASLATMDLADKKPDDARKRFEGLLAHNPKNGQGLVALAELAMARGAGKDEVVGLLGKAIDANPSEVTPRLLLINLLLGARDYKRASSEAQSAVSTIPTSPDLLDALGRVQQVSGDLNQAIATFGKVVAIRPLSAQAHTALATAYLANRNDQAAEQSARKAREIAPEDLEAQRALIMVLLESKRYEEAVTIARAVQAQRPKEAVGFILEGDIHAVKNDLNAAALAYRSGLQQVKATALATKLHTVLVQSGKPAEADRLAATWLNEHPKDLVFFSHMGEVAIARKDYAAAEKAYLKVVQLQPDSALALNNLAWVTQQLHKPGALAYAERANSLASNEPAFMDTLATLLSDNGDYSKAIAMQSKALQIQPANPSFRLNLAKIYMAAGDKARAKTELETLAKLGDKHPSSAEATALLKTL